MTLIDLPGAERFIKIPPLSLPGCEFRITPRGSLRLEGNAGSSFEFFLPEARRLRTWLNAAIPDPPVFVGDALVLDEEVAKLRASGAVTPVDTDSKP